MINRDRRQKLRNLDILYIVHNPLDCLVIYFCICFTFIRIVYDLAHETAPILNAYLIASIFTVFMGLIMTVWAGRAFKNLKLKDGIKGLLT